MPGEMMRAICCCEPVELPPEGPPPCPYWAFFPSCACAEDTPTYWLRQEDAPAWLKHFPPLCGLDIAYFLADLGSGEICYEPQPQEAPECPTIEDGLAEVSPGLLPATMPPVVCGCGDPNTACCPPEACGCATAVEPFCPPKPSRMIIAWTPLPFPFDGCDCDPVLETVELVAHFPPDCVNDPPVTVGGCNPGDSYCGYTCIGLGVPNPFPCYPSIRWQASGTARAATTFSIEGDCTDCFDAAASINSPCPGYPCGSGSASPTAVFETDPLPPGTCIPTDPAAYHFTATGSGNLVGTPTLMGFIP